MVVAGRPTAAASAAGLYHSQSPEGFFYHTPGLKVICPATPYDAKGLLKAAIRDDNPCLFLEHKRTYRQARGEVPDEDYTLPIGSADVKREGDLVTVISYGLMLHFCLMAAEQLAQEGLSVEVLDLRTVKPLDRQAIVLLRAEDQAKPSSSTKTT